MTLFKEGNPDPTDCNTRPVPDESCILNHSLYQGVILYSCSFPFSGCFIVSQNGLRPLSFVLPRKVLPFQGGGKLFRALFMQKGIGQQENCWLYPPGPPCRTWQPFRQTARLWRLCLFLSARKTSVLWLHAARIRQPGLRDLRQPLSMLHPAHLLISPRLPADWRHTRFQPDLL